MDDRLFLNHKIFLWLSWGCKWDRMLEKYVI